MIMEYFVGISLALSTFVFGRVARFDRERSFYAVMVLVVASYYLLFAAIGASPETLVAETIVFGVFAVAAVVGFRTNLWIVAAALAGHGVLDFFHGHLIENPGVPAGWPMFCMTFDVVAGAGLAFLLLRAAKSGVHPRQVRTESFRDRIRPHVDAELRAAAAAEIEGRASEGFRHLERAHVLGQWSAAQHVRVHIRMLMWGIRQKDLHEVMGQVGRVIGAAAGTWVGLVPHGNTGGSNVSGFRSMAIPDDLAGQIAAAGGSVANVS